MFCIVSLIARGFVYTPECHLSHINDFYFIAVCPVLPSRNLRCRLYSCPTITIRCLVRFHFSETPYWFTVFPHLIQCLRRQTYYNLPSQKKNVCGNIIVSAEQWVSMSCYSNISWNKVMARANLSVVYGTVRRVDARLTSKVIAGVSDQARRAHTRFCIQTTAQHMLTHSCHVYVYTSLLVAPTARCTHRQTDRHIIAIIYRILRAHMRLIVKFITDYWSELK